MDQFFVYTSFGVSVCSPIRFLALFFDKFPPKLCVCVVCYVYICGRTERATLMLYAVCVCVLNIAIPMSLGRSVLSDGNMLHCYTNGRRMWLAEHTYITNISTRHLRYLFILAESENCR